MFNVNQLCFVCHFDGEVVISVVITNVLQLFYKYVKIHSIQQGFALTANFWTIALHSERAVVLQLLEKYIKPIGQ